MGKQNETKHRQEDGIQCLTNIGTHTQSLAIATVSTNNIACDQLIESLYQLYYYNVAITTKRRGS
jgi:hypothetical protein